MNAEELEHKLSLEFKRGYYIAVANMVRLHRCEVEARDTLEAYGKIDFVGIDPYDVKTLKPLAAESKRLSKLSRKTFSRSQPNNNEGIL